MMLVPQVRKGMPGEAKHLTQVLPQDTALTAAGSRALNPSGAPVSSYNTLSRLFVCLFLLFLIFVAVSMNSSVLAGKAEMEQQQKNQTHKKYISATKTPG